MYLVHFALLTPCLIVAGHLAPGHGTLTLALHAALTAACSFGVACVTYCWIEQPCIQAMARVLAVRRSQPLPHGA